MARYSLYLFGLPRLLVNDEPVDIERKKAVALLAVLAVDDRSHSRAFLSTFFWPESSAKAARNNLRHTLTMLRRGLGAEAIDADRDTVALRRGDDLWVDVREFRRLLGSDIVVGDISDDTGLSIESARLQRWAAAADLYTQDFLAGFSLPDCADFDDWQRARVLRLRRAALQTLQNLAWGYLARQEYATALEYAERGLVLDGMHEPLARVAMEVYTQLGNRAAVQRIYDTFVTTLRSELDVDPHPRTRALHAELLQNQTRAPVTGSSVVASEQDPTPETIPPIQAHDADAAEDKAQAPPTTDLASARFQTHLSPLIGRSDDIAAVNRILDHDGARLVTLVGPGGVGKTRLAQQIGVDRQSEFADGVCFVSLASIRAPHLVIHSVAQALGVHPKDNRALAVILQEHLQSRQTLLVLDNFEQVMPAARLVVEMLEAAPALKMLITSREPLRIDGEVLYHVQPLVVPRGDAISQEDVEIMPAIYPSIALFIHRLRAQQSDYSLSADAVRAIGAICVRIDGLPLAIELAASLTRLFTPQALLRRLQDVPALRMLRDERRDRPLRQHSLWQTLDWSYQLLSGEEQAYLRALSVFAGGCTLESAHAVCCDEATLLAGHMLDETVAHLHALVDKCLVLVEEGADGNPRISLLETVREYAGEQLHEAGEEATLQALHARHYLVLAERAEPELTGPKQGAWLDRLETDHDNLRAVLARWLAKSSAQDEEAIGPRLGAALWHYWYMRGHHSEGLDWLRQLIQAPLSSRLQARILHGMSMLTRRLRDHTAALGHAQESLSLYRSLGDRAGTASVLRVIGFLHYVLEDPETARGILEESLSLFRELQDEGGIAAALTNLAYVATRLGDLDAVQAYGEESLAMRLAAGNHYAATTTLAVLAFNALFRGDNQAAVDYAEQSLQLCRQIGNQNGAGVAEAVLGLAAIGRDDYAAAQVRYQTTYRTGRKTGDRALISMGAHHLGMLALMQGERDRAAEYLRQSFDIQRQGGSSWQWVELSVPIAALALALSMPIRALHIAAAVVVAQERLSLSLLPSHIQMLDRTIATARDQVDAAEADAAWQAGQAMTMEEVVAQVEDMFAWL